MGFSGITSCQLVVIGKDDVTALKEILPTKDYFQVSGKYKLLKILSFVKVFKTLNDYNYVFTRDLVVVISSLLTKKKVIYEIHKKPKFINILIFRALRKYIKICAISGGISNYCLKNLNFKKENIITLHDAVNFKDYEQILQDRQKLRSNLGMCSNNVHTFYSGTVDFGRDMYRIIELSENFREIIFYIAGDNGDNFKKVLNLETIPKNIIFLGYVVKTEIVKYQVASDILLNLIDEAHPNINFCSQLKLFEYFASGNLIISPDIGSLSEVVNKSNCFIYKTNIKIESSNITNIFKKCVRLLENDYPRMPCNIEYARNNTWQIRAQKILNFY